MTRVIKKGPENITLEGRKIPAWFIDELGHRYKFEGAAPLNTDGGIELQQLRPDQCVLAPGALYQREKR